MPGQSRGDEGTDMTVDLFSLKRQDKLMVLTVGITPDKSSDADASTFFGWTDTLFRPQIVDSKNLKVHEVVTGGEDKPVSTESSSSQFGPGQTLYLYAVFAAPPEDVDTVTVKAIDGAPAFTGVKIQ